MNSPIKTPPPPAQPKQMWLWSDQWVDIGTACRLLRMRRWKVMRLIERGDVRAFQDTGERGWWKVSYESCIDYLEVIRTKYEPVLTVK